MEAAVGTGRAVADGGVDDIAGAAASRTRRLPTCLRAVCVGERESLGGEFGGRVWGKVGRRGGRV